MRIIQKEIIKIWLKRTKLHYPRGTFGDADRYNKVVLEKDSSNFEALTPLDFSVIGYDQESFYYYLKHTWDVELKDLYKVIPIIVRDDSSVINIACIYQWIHTPAVYTKIKPHYININMRRVMRNKRIK